MIITTFCYLKHALKDFKPCTAWNLDNQFYCKNINNSRYFRMMSWHNSRQKWQVLQFIRALVVSFRGTWHGPSVNTNLTRIKSCLKIGSKQEIGNDKRLKSKLLKNFLNSSFLQQSSEFMHGSVVDTVHNFVH